MSLSKDGSVIAGIFLAVEAVPTCCACFFCSALAGRPASFAIVGLLQLSSPLIIFLSFLLFVKYHVSRVCRERSHPVSFCALVCASRLGSIHPSIPISMNLTFLLQPAARKPPPKRTLSKWCVDTFAAHAPRRRHWMDNVWWQCVIGDSVSPFIGRSVAVRFLDP